MQQNTEIKFGTDGWRGIISDNFTFANVRRVAAAIADYYIREAQKASVGSLVMAVGYDTRFLSADYAQAVSEVLSSRGIEVVLSECALPTPALSFAVRSRKLFAGVMITASHNPAEYNGIKIKTASGGAAGVEVTAEVEKLLENPLEMKTGLEGKIKKTDLVAGYVKFLRGYINLKMLKKSRYRVLVDSMHGSGNGFIEEVLRGTGIRLTFTRREVNPSFGGLRPEPVLENLQQTRTLMRQGAFDLCLVLDGDADRIAGFAGKGEFLPPQKILGLLALHLFEDRGMTGGIVKTIVGTNLIDNLANDLGLKLHETPVGFKYISRLMDTDDILVGGEEAGGMGFKGYIPERDGTLAGILLLEMMAARKKPMMRILQEMEKKYGRYYYLRDDLRIPDLKVDLESIKKTPSILGRPVVEVKDYDGVKLILDDGSWLMFRGSGTEPIMRVYAESKSLAKTRKLLAFGSRLIFHKT